MTETRTYHEQIRIDQTLRLREVLKTLPPFAKDFFRAIEPRSSAKTRMNYAYDIRVFFHFLMENNPVYKNYTMDQFAVTDLERLEPVDIEEYMEDRLSIIASANEGFRQGQRLSLEQFKQQRFLLRELNRRMRTLRAGCAVRRHSVHRHGRTRHAGTRSRSPCGHANKIRARRHTVPPTRTLIGIKVFVSHIPSESVQDLTLDNLK